jgi:hypothetical protein
VAIRNKELVKPQYWAEPNLRGLGSGFGRRKGERGLTTLESEIEKLHMPCLGKYNGIQHRQKVEDFAKECSLLFHMAEPECFEEILCCGIAVFVVRVSVFLGYLIRALIDVALTSMTVFNLLMIQQEWFCNPGASSELAVEFTRFIAAFKKMLLYLKVGIPLERAYEQLKNCFVAVIIVLDAAQFTEDRSPGTCETYEGYH